METFSKFSKVVLKIIFALRADMKEAKDYRDHQFLENVSSIRGTIYSHRNEAILEDRLDTDSVDSLASGHSFDDRNRNLRRIGRARRSKLFFKKSY